MPFLPKGVDHAEQEWESVIEKVFSEGNHFRWSLGRNFLLAMFTVLYYDYILTFNTEKKLIWKNWSVTSVTLLFLRYFSLVAHIPMAIVVFGSDWDGISSDRYLIFPKIYQCIAVACVTLILSIRIHCLYNNRFVTYLMGLLWIVTNVANSIAWAFASSGYIQGQTSSFLLPLGCTFELPGEAGVTISGHAWGIRMIYEMLILCMTIGRSWYLQGIRCQIRIPIVRILTRNGAIYFFIILISECLSMIVISAAVSGKQVMFNTVQISALSRLVFNLQREIIQCQEQLSLEDETEIQQVPAQLVTDPEEAEPSIPTRLRPKTSCFLRRENCPFRSRKENRLGDNHLQRMREASESINASDMFTCTRTSTRQVIVSSES